MPLMSRRAVLKKAAVAATVGAVGLPLRKAAADLAKGRRFTMDLACSRIGVRADLPAATDVCPQCHQSTNRDANPPDSPAGKGRGARNVLDNPWIILGTLFFVTAALGLPFLWVSRGFSRLSKFVLSIVVILYTILILWLFWMVVSWSWTRISDSL